MRIIRTLTVLLCFGICLGNGDVSPKLTEMGRALIEYVNNNKE